MVYNLRRLVQKIHNKLYTGGTGLTHYGDILSKK